jgi:hypothetical protein
MLTLSANNPQWLLNCASERAEAIMAVSPYVLVTGPPSREGELTPDELSSQGLVGLYRTKGRKEAAALAAGRQEYLASVDRQELLNTGRARMILKSVF